MQSHYRSKITTHPHQQHQWALFHFSFSSTVEILLEDAQHHQSSSAPDPMEVCSRSLSHASYVHYHLSFASLACIGAPLGEFRDDYDHEIIDDCHILIRHTHQWNCHCSNWMCWKNDHRLHHRFAHWHDQDQHHHSQSWYSHSIVLIFLSWVCSDMRMILIGVFAINLLWTPSAGQYGPQTFCAAPIDNTNVQGSPWCITFLVGFTGPNLQMPLLVQGSASPVGTIFSNHSIFSIQGKLLIYLWMIAYE